MKLVYLLALIFPFNVWAVETPPQVETVPTFKVRQNISARNRVVVEADQAVNFPAGKVFLITFPDGKQCSLMLKETKATLLTFDSSHCDQHRDITKGLPVEPSLVELEDENPPVVQQQPKKEDIAPAVATETMDLPHRVASSVGVSLHYSFANEMRFDDAYVFSSGGSGKVEATFKASGSAGVGLSWAQMRPMSWGFVGSVLYEPPREIDSVIFKGPGGSSTGVITGTKPKVSFFIFEGNAVYRWNTFYLPFGLNASVPSLSDISSSTNIEVKGNIGAFVGGGFLIGQQSSLEIFLRSIAITMTESDSTGSINYDRGTLTGVGVGYKYWF